MIYHLITWPISMCLQIKPIEIPRLNSNREKVPFLFSNFCKGPSIIQSTEETQIGQSLII